MSTFLAEQTYERLMVLIPPLREIVAGEVHTSAPRARGLHLQVLEQTPYTSVLTLTQHGQVDGLPVPDPALTLRAYHDLRVAEGLRYCSRLGADVALTCLVQRPLELKTKRELDAFVWKWLGQCLIQGHRIVAPVPMAG